MTTRYVDRCQTDGCPQANSEEWHRCFVCGKAEGDHQHVPKLGMGGNNPDSKIVAFLCRYHHDKIDNGPYWGNAVLDVHGVGKVYRIWRTKDNSTVLERVIEAAPEQASSPLEQVWDNESDEEAFGDKDTDTSQEVKRTCEPSRPITRRGPQLPTLPVVKEVPYEAAYGADGTSLVMPPPQELPPAMPVQYEATYLRLPENMPYEKWLELGSTLQTMGKGLAWWLGDWLNFGEAKFGEKYSQAVEETGVDKGRLANYAWVASNVDPSLRRDDLSWSHHRMVADLNPNEQAAWLEKASEDNLTANGLRAMIKGVEPDTCPKSATGRHEYQCIHCKKAR